jgi:hypothetical protein
MTNRRLSALAIVVISACSPRTPEPPTASPVGDAARATDLAASSSDGSASAEGGGADAALPANDGFATGTGPLCTQPVIVDTGATAIVIDGHSAGRKFEAIGGLSGGGGTSRLLIDYPELQRSEILDFLFKPGFGAALQLLKVEIGGDTDTTNGAEASHQRTPTDQNYHRGYEWWLMQEAKKRNPDIKLYGLEWGAPGWFAGGYFSQDNTDYIINWISHAKSDYGLIIDYVGCRNEMACNKTWLEKLKGALQSHGLATQVVSNDSVGWGVATQLTSDPTYAAAVDVIGAHYPCGYLKDGTNCGGGGALTQALALGKRMWASEQGSQPYGTGAVPMAREYNRGYIQAKITASINWSLVGAWYTSLPFGGVDGLLAANQPWSGHYEVEREIWTTAHTTQFVRPGWQYLDSGSAVVPQVGSYVTLRAPNGKDWTTIIETTEATADVTFSLTETGGVFEGPVHVWATNLGSTNSKDWFIQQPDVSPEHCQLSFTAAPHHVYTLSTTSGQMKGTTVAPPLAAWKLPYSDDFESYDIGSMPNLPRYLSAIEGAFEVEHCGAGRSGKCVQQEIGLAPDSWKNNPVNAPIAFIGDPGWTDYKVSVDVMLPEAGFTELMGRFAGLNRNGGGANGYHFQVSDAGAWKLYRQDTKAQTTLASGSLSSSLSSWHTLALSFKGTTISVFYDGSTIGSVTDTTYAKGNAAIAASKWIHAQFDNLSFGAP